MKKTNNYFINFSLIMSGNDRNSAIKLNKINENLKNFSLQILLESCIHLKVVGTETESRNFNFKTVIFKERNF